MFTIARKDPKWWCAGATDPNPRVKLCQDAAQEYISNTPASEGWGGFREIEEFATAALPGYLIEFLQSDDKAAEAEQNVSEWIFSPDGADSSLRKLYADHQSFIDTGIDDARGQPTTDTRLVFEQVIGATPNTAARSVAPAATPDHVQHDHDTGSAPYARAAGSRDTHQFLGNPPILKCSRILYIYKSQVLLLYTYVNII
jgi:hypothetical protein